MASESKNNHEKGYPRECQAEEDIGNFVLIFFEIHISVQFPQMSPKRKHSLEIWNQGIKLGKQTKLNQNQNQNIFLKQTVVM